MSSATLTKAELPPKGGSHKVEANEGFRVWHFFVLVALVTSTAAVLVTKQARPESLILLSLTIGAAGAAAIGFYRMLAPLTAADAELISEPLSDRLRADLEREKALTLRSIKELEFDRAMGKLSPQDFEEMAGRLRGRAIGIMKQLDAGTYRSVIEKELAARIERTSKPDLQVGRAAKKQVGECACGTSNDPDARFCKRCGAKLA
jgi:hypothetical protein